MQKARKFFGEKQKKDEFFSFSLLFSFFFFSLLLSFLSRLDKTKTSLSQKLFFRFTTRKEEDKQHEEDKDKDELKKRKKKRARRKKKKKKISTTTSQNQHHKKKKKYIYINVGFTQTSGKSLEQKRVHEFILLVLKVRRRGGVIRESRDTV
jgi:hypothetical protein